MGTRPRSATSSSQSNYPNFGSMNQNMSDVELLHKWMNVERVNKFWGEAGPIAKQEAFLRNALQSRHSYPIFGCWDGVPFGFFEIYWVKEDPVGKYLSHVSDWDRGLHCLVGEEEYRGKHRVKIWLSALAHYLWLSDSRVEMIIMEPRVDNEKFIGYLQEFGFYKEREIPLPHKQAALMKMKRESWEAPAL